MDAFDIALQLRNAFAYVYSTHSVSGSASVVDLQGVYTNLRRVCKDMGIKCGSCQLENHSSDGEKVTINEFLGCVEKNFISNLNITADECCEIEHYFWQTCCRDHYELLKGTFPHFSEENAFVLWRIFNRLSLHAQLGEAEVSTVVGRFVESVGVRINGFICAREHSIGGGVSFFPLLERISNSIPRDVNEKLISGIIKQMEDELIGQVIKCGLLTKRGGLRHTWKERWFVLKPGIMHYYTDEHCREQKGTICINSTSRTEATEGKNHQYKFIVVCGKSGRVFEIEAPTEVERVDWVQAIRRVIHSNGKSPLEMEIIHRKKGASQMWGSPQRQPAHGHIDEMVEISKRRLAEKRCSMELDSRNELSSDSDGEVFENVTRPHTMPQVDLASKLREIQAQHEKLKQGLADLERDYKKNRKVHST